MCIYDMQREEAKHLLLLLYCVDFYDDEIIRRTHSHTSQEHTVSTKQQDELHTHAKVTHSDKHSPTIPSKNLCFLFHRTEISFS